MGRDAYVHIDKKHYNKRDVSELLLMMGYKVYGNHYYLGDDEEYKYLSGVYVWLVNDENELVYQIRTQAFASGYDIYEQNNTIRKLKKYCSACFESDMGKNRYFEESELIKGAQSGCYFALQKLDNKFNMLEYSLSKYPVDSEEEKLIYEFGFAPPSTFNANVYLSFLCSLIEEYFKSTYIALLKYSDRKDKVLHTKFSPYDLRDISEGKETVEEVFARMLSFQNIDKIVNNFQGLDPKIDIGTPLKKPYRNRKESLYQLINRVFEQRHNMIHRLDIDIDYSKEKLVKDVKDIKFALIRVYKYLCEKYGWEVDDILL